MDITKLATLGKELGYEGQELREFVNMERDKEEQRMRREEDKEREKIAREEERIKREEVKERDKLEREERNRVREEAKEKDRVEREKREKEEEHQRFLEKAEKEMEMLKLKKSVDDRGQGNTRQEQPPIHRPKLPKFEEDKDDLDAYLERFERFAKVQKWKKEEWAVCLSPLLTGKGLQVFTGMPVNDVNDYDKLKRALLKRYQLTEEGFRKRFREETPDRGETVYQFISRIRRYLQRWVELSGIEKTFDALQDLLIKEQYLRTCSRDLDIFLRERVPKNVEDLTTLAEQYIEAHASRDEAHVEVFKSDTEKAAVATNQCDAPREFKRASGERRCYVCDRTNHIARDCFYRKSYRRTWNDSEIENNRGNSNQTEGVDPSTHGNIEMNAEKSGHMPVRDGLVNNKKVKVLRDTGCSSAAVRETLVDKHQRTGKETTCILIDGTERKFPVARIYVDTPYYTGHVEAMCIVNPLYDLILGNMQQIDRPDSKVHMEGNAMVTKAQTETVQKPRRTLHRNRLNRDGGNAAVQKTVPVRHRQKILHSDHEHRGGDQSGARKTTSRINNGRWPRIISDVTKVRKICDRCAGTNFGAD
jgi:hypothetical protein